MNELITGRFFVLLREVSQAEQTTRSLHALRLELVSTEALYLSRPGGGNAFKEVYLRKALSLTLDALKGVLTKEARKREGK